MKSSFGSIAARAGFCLVFLFLFACQTGKYELQIIRNFDPEIEQQQNLEFSFNKDLLPDSLLNKWDSIAYMEISPAVKGSFKWSNSNLLIFSPAEGFLPGTEYTATPTKQLVKYSTKKYSIDKTPIHFNTAPLRVTNTHLAWTKGKNATNLAVQLEMSFNYAVNINDVASRLKLSSGGNPINITSISSGTSKALTLQFMPVNNKDEETPLKIDIAKGIPVSGSKYVTARDTSLTTAIPSRYNLSITGIIAQHTGNEGVITVSTSQPVNENNLKDLIKLEPSVLFQVTPNDAGFTITSAQISVDQMYQLTISTKLEGAFGGKLKSDYSEHVTFGKLRPSLSFINNKGIYLSAAGYKNLALNIINIPSIEVSVVKVYENNLEQFMRKDKSSDYHYDEEDGEGSSYEYYDTENLGDVIFQKNYETAKLPKQNASHILHLDFQDKIKDFNGVYVIQVRSKEHNWITQSKILSVSDIGLIVKEEKDGIYVFANSIKTATPLSEVKVSFVSTNNQKLYTAVTDAEGLAVFKNINATSPGFRVALVTAKKNEEFTFVWFNQARIGTSRFDVGGRTVNETGLIAMIYAERNLYRPGETIHVSTIVRDEQWNNQVDVPVKIKLIMPNGKEFVTVRKILNDQGSCETSFAMPPSAMTGNYIAEVFTGNDVLLNSYNISVEDFMPDRMKVSLALDNTAYKPGDDMKAAIQADNLFGTPAAGRNYQCEMNISKITFTSDKYEDYNFALSNEFTFNTENREGKTDDKGSANQVFKLETRFTNNGLLKGTVMATVFDETGRPVHRYGNFDIYTQPLFAGLKCKEDYVTSRAPVRMALIALDKNSAPQTAQARIVVIKKEWHTVIQKNDNTYRYVSQSEDRIITQQNISITGTNTTYAFTPQQSGEYEVRLFLNGSENYVSKTLYAYGWGDTQYTSFEVNNEGNVEIKTDKKEYNTGESVQVLFTTPFEGRMLVTLERDHVIKHYYLNTKNKSASLTLNTDETMLPNVYITATLFRPMDGGDMPLTVAHGFQSVSVVNKSYQLPVTITAVEKSRAQTKQTITVKTAPGAYVTIAAVDEGILQVKNFATPNAYDYFYQKVALAVNSYDIYPWLLPEIKTTRSTTGGDGADSRASRLSPMFVNRVKNVSFWSGILQADGNGNVKYDINVPQFSGDIRIMALAYKNKGFGSADKHIKVADPVVISTALPRFLSPKDEVVMPVSLSNTTNKPATATITVKTSEQFSIAGTATQTIEIPANKEQRVVFNLTAQPSIGAGSVTVTVKAFGETFTDKTDIAIRPPASLQKLTGSGYTGDNANTVIDMKTNFIPASVSGKLIVAKSPMVQFSKHIDALVRYPHGCVEQTVSAAFPQLYYADLVKSMNAASGDQLNPAYNVQQAINKLQSMQLGNGSLSYWPQGGGESWWGSVYACHFMLEAKKIGCEVNDNTLNRLEEYLKFRLYKKEVTTFFYNGTMKKNVAPEEVPYSLYVLAMAGQSQQPTMNYYKAHQELLTLDGKYLLAAAYTLSGQPAQAKDVLPPAFAGEDPNKSLDGSFYSYIRDQALSLNVLMDTDPTNRQVGIMAKQLSEGLAKERYLSTQENAFSILALGKVAKLANQTTSTASVTAGTKTIGNTQGAALTMNMKPYANDAIALQVKGKGGYYYFWEMAGITADGSYKEEDNFIRVRRTFFDRNGREAGTSFRQNDLVVVRISIEAMRNDEVENVAITDMLPAGFEIENTRLNEMPNMPWIKEPAEAEYTDIRDDRINLFTTVTKARKDFYYMVRAVSPGTYHLGPVQTDAMYDGNYHSYNGAGIIKIADK